MTTRGTSTAAARSAVFNTQELLEAILVALPIKDLWKVGRVCRAWKASVEGSVKARRGMFLAVVKVRPTLSFSLQACQAILTPRSQKHTLLTFSRPDQTLILAQLAGPPSIPDPFDAGNRRTTITTSTLNPLLFTPLTTPLRPSLVDRSQMCETLSFARSTLDFAGAWHDKPEMGKMLIANPSPNSIEIEIAFTLNNRPRPLMNGTPRSLYPERHAVTSATGVTWADILRELDVILLCAQRRWMREELARGKGAVKEGRVGLDVGRCKVWMRGVVFPTEEEIGCLVAGNVVGREGIVGVGK